MSLNPPADWKVPGLGASETDKMGWLANAISQGEAFIKEQDAYKDIAQARQIIMGGDGQKLNNRSDISDNLLKRDSREIIATLSNLRPLWAYKTDNPQLAKNANVINKLSIAWWYNGFVDRSIREGLQYMGVDGTGYVSPIWDRDMYHTGRGDIALHAYGADSVLPIQIGRDNNLQRAYAVVIKTPVPVAQAWAMWPHKTHILVPDRMNSTSMFQRGLQKVQRFIAPALRYTQMDKDDKQKVHFPEVDIFNVYIIDTTVNFSDREIPMGDAGTSWFYKVPYIGQQIPTGQFNSAGQLLYKTAAPEDCLLYPMRRCLTATRRGTISDGTSMFWHGKAPIVQFKADDWPWMFLGYSLMKDGMPLQKGIDKLQRAMIDSADLRLKPPMQYDEASVTKTLMERLDLRKAGAHVGFNMQMGEGIKPLLDPHYYDVQQWIPALVQTLKEDMKNILGTSDVSALLKARQIPSSDSIEKLLEMAGPLVTDVTRGMERSMRDLGEMTKSNFFQFYTTARKVQLLGPDGVTEEDYDYDPGNMVPSHMPGEPTGSLSRYSHFERAKHFSNQFGMRITQNSLTQITQMSRKLLYLQLYRSGFPIDPWTVGDVLDIPNFGDAPQGTGSVIEKWRAWRVMMMEETIELQNMAQSAQVAMQAKMQLLGLAGMMSGSSAAPAGGNVQRAKGLEPGGGVPPAKPGGQTGRPPSGGAPPNLETKDGGQRTTITESHK
jgi:hypothetical protein